MISLQQLHSFGLPAQAQSIDIISSENQLFELNCSDTLPLILGEGSNTIFVEDYLGKVGKINLKGIEITEYPDFYLVDVKAGENWHQFVTELVAKGINGLENLALIPGSVGAAPVQNIGAYGAELADFCHTVICYHTLNNELIELSNQECQFGYRDSLFKQQTGQSLIITGVRFKLPRQWKPNLAYHDLTSLPPNATAKQVLDKVVAIRGQKLPDPDKLGNAGSFFKNPVISSSHFQRLADEWPAIPAFNVASESHKVPAAWLIEQCGFKGKQWGGVGCYQHQPLVLVNKGNGTGNELLQAAREIRDTVKSQFDIELVNEVRLIGNNGIVQL